jgi:hypothetical protein
MRTLLRSADADDPTGVEWERLSARLAPILGGPGTAPPSSAPPPPAPVSWLSWVVAVAGVAGLVALGVAVWLGAPAPAPSAAPSPPPAPAEQVLAEPPIAPPPPPARAEHPGGVRAEGGRGDSEAREARGAKAGEPHITTAEAPAADAREAEATSASGGPRAGSAPNARGTRARAPAPSPTPAPGPPVADAIALIDAAERSLRSADPAAALRLTQEHERLFPSSVFGEEREAIAIEALARLGHTDEARRRFARFSERHPESGYRWRLGPLLSDH